MGTKDRQSTKSGDLVLIGDYLRAVTQAAPAEKAGERPDGGESNVGAPVNGGLLMLRAVLEHCTYPQIAELKSLADELARLVPQWDARYPAAADVASAGQLLRRQREVKDQHEARKIEDVHDIVVMFHRAVAALAQGSQRNLRRLGTLERDLGQAARMNDLVALRGRLGSVLEFIQSERDEEKAQATRVVEKLKKDFQAIEVAGTEGGTGLSGKELAVATLRRSWAPDMMAAAVHFEQTRGVTERHGPETAQRLTNEILGQVAQRVDVPYAVYPWNLSSVLLIFEGISDNDQMRRTIRQQLVTIPGTFILDVASRKTLFRFPHHWLVLSHAEEPLAEKAVRKIEEFLAGREA